MIKLKKLILENKRDESIKENDSTPSDTFKMYHGGKRWSCIPSEFLGSKEGRYECGPGIYFTNNYNTARSYAKGSRVVHLVEIDRNFTDLKQVQLPLEDVIGFVKGAPRMKHKKEIIEALIRNAQRMNSNSVPADILNNLIVNYRAGAGKTGIEVVKYFVSKGIDATIQKQSGDEIWLIVFNPNIIKSVSVVDPSKITSDFPFMIPPTPNLIRESSEPINTEDLVKHLANSKGYTYETYRGDVWADEIYSYTPKERVEHGIFTTPIKEIASIYAGSRKKEEPRKFYVRAPKLLNLMEDSLENMRWVENWAESFDEWIDRTSGEPMSAWDILQSGQMFDYEGTWSRERWIDIQATAESDGFDAVILPDYDSSYGVFPSLVIFNENNLKLADAITYDDEKNPIPLKSRFDSSSNDIRY